MDMANRMTNSYYIQINLNEVIKGIGEDETKRILSSFSCPLNHDVEMFLHDKAIEFSKRGFAKTHLVFWLSPDGLEKELVGYYALATKSFILTKDAIPKNLYKKLSQYGTYNTDLRKTIIPALLIGQLGKNYDNGNDCLISGGELLQLALEKVQSIQNDAGVRYAYLECEDIPALVHFYEKHGFVQFGKRALDVDESNIKGSYLIQLLKKISR